MTRSPDGLHPAERFFSAAHPLHLTLQFHVVGVEPGRLRVALVAPESFAHGGATHSALAVMALDSVMGGAVMGEMPQVGPIATASLTSQHMRRARVGERLEAEAHVHGIHLDLAHVTGRLTGEDGAVLSLASGTFMLGTRSRPLGARV